LHFLLVTASAPALGSHDCNVTHNPVVNCGVEAAVIPDDGVGWDAVDIASPLMAFQIGGAGLSPGFGLFTSAPTEGSFAALHGFDGAGPGTIESWQDITVPLTGETELHFDYRAGWDLLNYAAATLDRTYEVVIEPAGGGAPLQTTLILTAPAGTVNLDTGDLTATVDLSAFDGMSIRIKSVWTIPETFTGPAFFQLDNIAIVPKPACVASANSSDAEILTLVDTLRPIAMNIDVDTDGSDWATIPIYPDAADDIGPADPSREIVATAIAPLDQEVLVLVRTAGAPSQTDDEIAIALDLLGGPLMDVAISLRPSSGLHHLTLFPPGTPFVPPPAPPPPPPNQTAILDPAVTDPDVEASYGADFIEVRIPYAALETPLTAAGMYAALAHGAHRSWVRAWAISGDDTTKFHAFLDYPVDFLDAGPAAASFRLITTPFALDPPYPDIPRAPGPPTPIQFPLLGPWPGPSPWLVGQGPAGEFSHPGYGYDLVRVDGSLARADPQPGVLGGSAPMNEDYFAFGSTIRSPVDGAVTEVVSDQEDDATPLSPDADLIQNYARINITDHPDDLAVSLGHAKQNSVTVTPQQAVFAGDPIGLVGNSGYSTEPHIHVNLEAEGEWPIERPIAFENVRVSLNPVPNDPWARECASWEPRGGGFLVARTEGIAVPAMRDVGLGALAALVTGFGWLALRRRSESEARRRVVG
jgi:murein DD-endopeptidase MepM/ murein hydrolase activator NlpD